MYCCVISHIIGIGKECTQAKSPPPPLPHPKPPEQNPSFHNMKQLSVLLLSTWRDAGHYKVTPSYFIRLPWQLIGIHLYSLVERNTKRVTCFAYKNKLLNVRSWDLKSYNVSGIGREDVITSIQIWHGWCRWHRHLWAFWTQAKTFPFQNNKIISELRVLSCKQSQQLSRATIQLIHTGQTV